MSTNSIVPLVCAVALLLLVPMIVGIRWLFFHEKPRWRDATLVVLISVALLTLFLLVLSYFDKVPELPQWVREPYVSPRYRYLIVAALIAYLAMTSWKLFSRWGKDTRSAIESLVYDMGAVRSITSFGMTGHTLSITFSGIDTLSGALTLRFRSPQFDVGVDENEPDNDSDTREGIDSPESLDHPPIEPPPLPWHMISFVSTLIGEDRWQFDLCTDKVDYGWESPWPEVQGMKAQTSQAVLG